MIELSDVAERVLGGVDKLSGAEVTTYGDLAALCGTGPRQVGQVMRRYGHLTEWWRVVRADGRGHDPARAEPMWDEAGITHSDGRVALAAHRKDWNSP